VVSAQQYAHTHGYPPARVCVEQEDAVTQLHDAAEIILAARLRQRVANRIAESREKELIPTKPQAIDVIRSVAHELKLAGDALEEAARALLNVTGQGRQAKAAHLAGKRAKDAAEGLTGA
jgi:hypothetical protein